MATGKQKLYMINKQVVFICLKYEFLPLDATESYTLGL